MGRGSTRSRLPRAPARWCLLLLPLPQAGERPESGRVPRRGALPLAQELSCWRCGRRRGPARCERRPGQRARPPLSPSSPSTRRQTRARGQRSRRPDAAAPSYSPSHVGALSKKKRVTASARSKVSQRSSSPASTRAKDTCWRATMVSRRTGASVTEPNESVAEISRGSSTPPTPARSMARRSRSGPFGSGGTPS